MKTILRPLAPPPSDEVHVGCTAEGGKVHIFGTGPRRTWRRSFDPGEAVKLWRCLMGEMSTVTPDDESDDTMKLWNHVDPKLGDLWEFFDASGERLFCLDADQAMALAWSIEKCCGIALCTSTPGKEKMLREKRVPVHVWVLASRWMLTGDCAENGAKQLGGGVCVFDSADSAWDAVREYMRPLLNEAETDAFWRTNDVDNVLASVFDNSTETCGVRKWAYDGQSTKQSFTVTLTRTEVKHGE